MAYLLLCPLASFGVFYGYTLLVALCLPFSLFPVRSQNVDILLQKLHGLCGDELSSEHKQIILVFVIIYVGKRSKPLRYNLRDSMIL